MTVQDLGDDLKLKYADKIDKLLRQAENPAATPAEAEAFMQKAAQLMTEYQIDEAMLAAARGLTVDELIQDEFRYSGIYRTGCQKLAGVVAGHFDIRCVYGRDSYSKPITLPLYLAGFKSDIERARLLDTSLQLQMVSAMREWAKTVDFSWMDKGLAFRTRRDFTFGFASGVGSKLAEAKRAATVEAKQHEAQRAGTTTEAASKSVDLVLVGRKEQVKTFYDTVWGGRTRNVHHRYGGGAGNGYGAGFGAGRSANTNAAAGRVGGSKGAIGR